MMPTVQEDREHRRRGRFTLIETEHGHAWGRCAEVEGLFGEPPRGTYELFGWVPEPEGSEVRDDVLAEGRTHVTLA